MERSQSLDSFEFPLFITQERTSKWRYRSATFCTYTMIAFSKSECSVMVDQHIFLDLSKI